MKSIKIYLGIVTVLLIVAIGFGVYTWYLVQSLSAPKNIETDTTVGTEKGVTNEETKDTGSTTNDVSTSTKTEPIVIDLDSLSDAQRSVLSAFGHEGNTLVLTEEVILCAKNSLGDTRFSEIVNGAAPNPLEAVKLARCMQ